MTFKQRAAAGLLTIALALGSAAPFITSAGNVTEPNYSNYSIEQLESLITKLQKQLADLKAGSTCFVTDKSLSIGDGEGDELSADVKRLQDFLREKSKFPYKSTGYFGKGTRTSLIAFQTASGIATTGEFDAATRAKVATLSCKTASVKRPNGVAKGWDEAKAKVEAKKEQKQERKTETTESVKSITLSGSGANVAWTIDGSSKNGFKVVWSKTAAPTYPTRNGDKYNYYESSLARHSTLNAFNGSGEYHVRVCEYLGGSCGVYSNEIKVNL